MTTLWYRRPAETWNEALPVGNGRIGGMVFGGVHDERIGLNDDTLWSGAPQDGTNPGGPRTLKEVREFLAAGDYAKADETSKRMMGPYTQSYLALGDLNLKFEGIGEVTDYRRELDLATGIARTEFVSDGTRYVREVFCSNPDQVLVIRLTVNGPGKLNLDASFSSQLNWASLRRDGLTMIVKAPLLVDPTYYRRGKIVTDWNGEGMKSTTILRPVECDGDIQSSGNPGFDRDEGRGGGLRGRHASWKINNATQVTLILSTATSFNGYRKSPLQNGRDDRAYALIPLELAVRKPYETLRATHVADHARLFNRLSFSLGAKDDRPTGELLLSPTPESRNKLAELLFHFGRYLLIACSRPGDQPANLQGIWNGEMRAPWSGNFTININTQMNYWPAEPANLAECHQPLLAFIKELAVNGKAIARTNYDCDGWCAHHNTDLWRNAAPVGDWGAPPADPVWAMWQFGGVWLCQHLWEHYAFNRDERYLREHAYPVMKGACEFVLDWLVEIDGKLTTSPSTSPEHRFVTPDGGRRALAVGSTCDLSLIWDLFTNTIEAATVLGLSRASSDATAEAVDRSSTNLHPPEESAASAAASTTLSDSLFIQSLHETLAKLYVPRVLPDGRVAEWAHDFPEEEVHHRHVSHLLAVHPGRQWAKDERMLAAARKSLEVRGNASTGWSLAWKMNLWARLGDGEQAWDCIRILQTPVTTTSTSFQGGVYLNLFDAHPPFQIDGNFGFVSGVCEMLVQSHAGEIHLLPALPSAWPDGEVTGLRARGNVTIGLAWRGGKLSSATLLSPIKQTIRLRIGPNGSVREVPLMPEVVTEIRP